MAGWMEKPLACSKCGRETRGKTGICRQCMNGERMPQMRDLTVEQLVFVRDEAGKELVRRRDEIAKALKGAA